MFEPHMGPRVFALPCGVDFAEEVVAGLLNRMSETGPSGMGRVRLVVNSTRMRREILTALMGHGARILPKVTLVTELPDCFPELAHGNPVSPFRRKLELSQLVRQLLETDRVRAPRSALFDLTTSLQSIFAEMQSEGVDVEQLRALDVVDAAQHWQAALEFLGIAADFHEAQPGADADSRLRAFAERIDELWVKSPPPDPIIVAGSTGSRGATRILMERIARLDQGAVILPGFDFQTPPEVWSDLSDAMTSEDHPQFRYAQLMQRLDMTANEVEPWRSVTPPAPVRSDVISLSLRPAPVTDRWIVEGCRFQKLVPELASLTLIEAPSPRSEAITIACRLRDAAAKGQKAALISPDRMLTRQVTAALARWNIVPDDSAGQPLHLTASGQFLRHVVRLPETRMTAADLLILLKSPICNSDPSHRGQHLLATRELELWFRRHKVAFPTTVDLTEWSSKKPGFEEWALWLQSMLAKRANKPANAPLTDHVDHHNTLANALSDGQGEPGCGELWKQAAGEVAQRTMTALTEAAPAGGEMSGADYTNLLDSLLQAETVRRSEIAHPLIKILGTLEARVATADVMILGGLNEGSWPEPSAPDPWLNRQMRQKVGLLLPERQIGLAAHDYQQAASAPEVVLSRAVQSGETPTVASRWLSRLTNLLDGLRSAEGPEALAEMRARGQGWIAVADAVEAATPMEAAARPAPIVPVAARPARLSVTRIETLIRDPYAIFAEQVLGLRRIDPLTVEPDAPLQGIALHQILENFVKEGPPTSHEAAKARLIEIAKEVFELEAPWPSVRNIWLSKVQSMADWFVAQEAQRQDNGKPIALEKKGRLALVEPVFELTAEADRVDRTTDQAVRIFDYKSGQAPSKDDQMAFNKQLSLEIVLAAQGAFVDGDVDPLTISAAFIALGAKKEVEATLNDQSPDKILEDFKTLIRRWQEPDRGYVSRRYPGKALYARPYDHLARFGEWNDGDQPTPEVL